MNEQNKKPKVNPFVECCCGTMIYISFAVSFGVLTSEDSYYAPCGTKSSSYQWSYITYIFYIITCCLAGFLIPLMSFILIKLIESGSSCLEVLIGGLLIGFRIGMAVMALVCFAGLCHAYGEEESCGQLNDLILAYIIIVSISLGFACCGVVVAICCGACLGGGLLMGKMLSKGLEEDIKKIDQLQKKADEEAALKNSTRKNLENEEQKPTVEILNSKRVEKGGGIEDSKEDPTQHKKYLDQHFE